MLAGASSYSDLVDQAFWFILGVSAFLLVGVTAVMIYFTVRYSRSRNPVASQIEGSFALEAVWTVLPTILVLAMFYYGWTGFVVMRTIPEGAMKVTVHARMWSWLFEYPNGKQSTELVVPTGKPIALSLESSDVIHSFYVPDFRLKEDCMPGRTNVAWFQAERDGEYDIFCAEFCGDQHSTMLGKVRSVPQGEFDTWLATSSAASGTSLLTLKGCVACHSTNGTKVIGPTFKGMYGREEWVKTGDKVHKVTVDDEYIRRSILEPSADIVEGYQPLMPPMTNLITEDEITKIIETLKEIK